MLTCPIQPPFYTWWLWLENLTSGICLTKVLCKQTNNSNLFIINYENTEASERHFDLSKTIHNPLSKNTGLGWKSIVLGVTRNVNWNVYLCYESKCISNNLIKLYTYIIIISIYYRYRYRQIMYISWYSDTDPHNN